jgi:hypothetical protein
MISGGLFLFTYKATEFNFLGFILVLTASFTRLVSINSSKKKK